MEELTKREAESKIEDKIQDSTPVGMKETIQEKASSMMKQGQAEAKAYADEAQRQTKSALASGKEQAVGELGSLAQAIRQTGSQLRRSDKKTVAQYTDKAAEQIDRMSDYLSHRDVNQLIDEGEALARRNPEVFLGVTFGLGLLAARFIKSSRQHRHSERSYRHLEERESMSRPIEA